MSTPAKKPRRRRRKKETGDSRGKLSAMVSRRHEDAHELVHSIRAHKAKVAAAFRKRLETKLREDEAMPDIELTLELTARDLEDAIGCLIELDDRRGSLLVERASLAREVSRLASEELYPQAVSIRRTIDSALGKTASAELHVFSGRTPRKPKLLVLAVKRLLTRLKSPQHRLSAPDLSGFDAFGGGEKRIWGDSTRWISAVVTGFLSGTPIRIRASQAPRPAGARSIDRSLL